MVENSNVVQELSVQRFPNSPGVTYTPSAEVGNYRHTPEPCDCYTDTYGDIQRCPLHAAALELLEALRFVSHREVDGLPCFCVLPPKIGHHNFCQNARLAIAKALGGAA